MARYSKYTVSYGDTIQSIAQHEMGNVSLWQDIVDYNNLAYPYIVDSVEEKLNNPEGWVTTGDTIIIPLEVDLLDTDVDSLGDRDKELILGLALGRDLAVGYDERTYANKGLHGEVMRLQANGSGDIKTVQGVENLKQAITNRLLTPRGSLLMHPNYGSDIDRLLGSRNSRDVAIMLENDILATIKSDGRVESVDVHSSTIEGETYTGEFTVYLHSLQEYFELVVSGDESSFIIY